MTIFNYNFGLYKYCFKHADYKFFILTFDKCIYVICTLFNIVAIETCTCTTSVFKKSPCVQHLPVLAQLLKGY